MKKILAGILCVLLCFSFVGCGEGKIYKEALTAKENGEYEVALELFESIKDYKDSSDMIQEVEEDIERLEHEKDLEKYVDTLIIMMEKTGMYDPSSARILKGGFVSVDELGGSEDEAFEGFIYATLQASNRLGGTLKSGYMIGVGGKNNGFSSKEGTEINHPEGFNPKKFNDSDISFINNMLQEHWKELGVL